MKKITLSLAAATMLLGGLAGCGVDNQATDIGTNHYETGTRQGALGVDTGPGIGARNDLGGRVDHDGGFFRDQRQAIGEVEIGNERPRGFGTDFGQGRAGGFFGLDGDRQGQRAAAQTSQRTLDRIEEIDGVEQARVSGNVIEITVNEGIDKRRAVEIKRQAQTLADNKTIRVVN
ncbi:hypothetical protein ACFFHM_10450 [Halalkalibacter kiskunsagensis]|uniref:BON domain-containing protein n=1 Tax=Halalkalibacter kiskunsagensis TaxID=1548599 RepID=A0ABV6KC75_9BACI